MTRGLSCHLLAWLLLGVLLLAACDAATPAPTVPATLVSASATVAHSTPAAPPTRTTAPQATPTPVPPTATPTRTPTPTPAAQLKRLTEGGCCTQPFWSPNSQQVFFIDKPSAQAPSGIYAVDVLAPAAPKLWRERVAFYSSDLQYAIVPEGAFTIIERLSDGQRWRVRTGGRNVQLSPDRSAVVWAETPQTGALESRVTTIMGANIDGSEARPIASVLRGGVVGWLDNQRLLITARPNRSTQEVVLSALSLRDGSQIELARSERLRSILPAPNGQWIAYSIVFDKNPEQSGIWVVRSDGEGRRKLPVFGAFQWRDNRRLIFAPLDMDQPTHSFHEFDASTGAQRRLTPSESAPFKIANGDWNVSPDGSKIVYLDARDYNLWLWTFPN